MPKDGKRAIVRCRDDDHIHPFPLLNLRGCRALHIDGHQPDAAIHYAKLCREDGILTSLDGGGLRTNTHELLEFIDVAIVAERLCESDGPDAGKDARLPEERGCRVGGITMGEKGLLWYDEAGAVRVTPALPIPRDRVIDTNGAGDVFHVRTSIHIWPIPAKAGRTILSSPARPRPTRSEARQRSGAPDARRHRGGEAGVCSSGEIWAIGIWGACSFAGSINMDVVATAERHPKVGETVAGKAVLTFPAARAPTRPWPRRGSAHRPR